MKPQQEKKSLIEPRNPSLNPSDPYKEQLFKEKELKQQNILQNKYMKSEHEQHLTDAYADFKERLCYKYLVAYDSTDFGLLKGRFYFGK